MSTPSSILLALQTQLKNSSDLSYVEDERILLGVREDMLTFPSIILEPLRIDEADYVYQRQNLYLHVAVMGYVQVVNKDKDNLIAHATTKGILNLENDIKLAISSDRTINSNAIHSEILETVYDFYNYPVRNVVIELRIHFRQTDTTRS